MSASQIPPENTAGASNPVREQLLDDTAKVAIALQFSIQYVPDGHDAFLRILELVPYELRHPEAGS